MANHKNARNDLSAEYVRSILDYDPATGVFRWKVSLARRAPIGSIAGHKKKNRHFYIGIGGHEYLASRLAWLVMTGEWPPFEIDHKDTNPSNEATSSQNLCNRNTRIGKSGYRGVNWAATSNKWMATITINRKTLYLGIFDSAEEAWRARCEAADKLHGEFAKH